MRGANGSSKQNERAFSMVVCSEVSEVKITHYIMKLEKKQ